MRSSSPDPVNFTFTALGSALTGIAAWWLAILALHLTPALFAALIAYAGTYAFARLLERWWPGLRHTRAWGLLLLLAAIAIVGTLVIEHAMDTAQAGGGYISLLQQMANALDQLRTSLPPWLATHLPVSLEALREAAATWLRAHAAQIQLWGGHTLRGIGYAIIGLVIGALLALQLPVRSAPENQPPLVVRVRRGFDGLVGSFAAVMFAQLRIAALNTGLTAVYLLGILPMLGLSLPLSGTLVAVTFVFGLVPIFGNLISNTMIVTVSLTHGLFGAALSVAWLVAIHKLEYFLNAHIIGQRIRAAAWELLIAMLVLEALFGLAGLISAPIVYAQIKRELYDRGWLGQAAT